MYAALVPPEEVRGQVDGLIERMSENGRPGDPRRLRWSRQGDSHITLAFMASVEDPGELADTLADGLAAAPPVAVGLSGAGAFPDPLRARTLWLGVDDPAGVLPALARRTRSATHRAGAQSEGGRFRPHVTVARVRGQSVQAEVEALSGFSTPIWVARTVTLFESRPGARGARHEVIEEFPLGGVARRSQLPSSGR